MPRQESILSVLMWTCVAAATIAVTLIGAWWTGYPSELIIDIPNVGVGDDLRIDNIRGHIESLTKHPSRMSGSDGAEDAFQLIQRLRIDRVFPADEQVDLAEQAGAGLLQSILQFFAILAAKTIEKRHEMEELSVVSQDPVAISGPVAGSAAPASTAITP